MVENKLIQDVINEKQEDNVRSFKALAQRSISNIASYQKQIQKLNESLATERKNLKELKLETVDAKEILGE